MMRTKLTQGLVYISSLFPLPFSFCRVWIYRLLGVKIGVNVTIGIGTLIWSKDMSRIKIEDGVSIGNNVHIFSDKATLQEDSTIRDNCTITGWGEFELGFGSFIGMGTIIDITDKVIVEDCVAIGAHSKIFTHDMSYQWVTEGFPFKKAPVLIKRRSWFGSDVTIIAGVTIGKYSIIAPKAMVLKDVEPYGLYAGIPAQKRRNLKDKIKELKNSINLIEEVRNHLCNYLSKIYAGKCICNEEIIEMNDGDITLVFVDGKLKEENIKRYSNKKVLFFSKDITPGAFSVIRGSDNLFFFDILNQRYTKKGGALIGDIKSELRHMGLIFKPFV